MNVSSATDAKGTFGQLTLESAEPKIYLLPPPTAILPQSVRMPHNQVAYAN